MSKRTNPIKNMRVRRDRLRVTGVVEESFRSAVFSVRLDVGNTIVQCTLCGKMKENYIKIVSGDAVEVELCEYDMTKGRIVTRVRK
jgi:translation initiation factor IF-1